MGKQDIRWQQRFSNYRKALARLEVAVQLANERELSDLEEQGLIQAFEFTHELAWNVLKDYLTYQGIAGIIGSRDASREAFNLDLVSDGKGWMEMINSRNKTSHTYNEETAEEIAESVKNTYFQLFKNLEQKMEALRSGSQQDIFSEDT